MICVFFRFCLPIALPLVGMRIGGIRQLRIAECTLARQIKILTTCQNLLASLFLLGLGLDWV